MMRLDKYLAYAGIGTRKEVKLLIRKKHVKINNILCIKDDFKINEYEDEVKVDDEVIFVQLEVYIMMNKPTDVICANEDGLHDTVFNCIIEPIPANCFTIGRLDIDTEGLLLITNDGKLSHDLLSPKKHVNKVYYVETQTALSLKDMQQLKDGILIDQDEQCLPAQIEEVNECAYHLTIQEGKFHQVKRMMEALHNKVVYLKRIQMGPITLDSTLAVGEYRYLSDEEIYMLKERT